jgi:multiple sugar transport system substrate-binding protein
MQNATLHARLPRAEVANWLPREAAVRISWIATLVSATLLATPVVAADSPVQLLLWHMEQTPERVQRIQELMNEFNAAHPDIKIRQEAQSWDDAYAKVPAAIAASNAPDLVFTIPDFTPVVNAAAHLQPVDDVVADLDRQHHFVSAMVAPYSYGGHIWSIPLYAFAQSLWYRKSQFSEAGLQPPTTWSAWLKAAKALTKDGVYGMGLPANKQLYTDQTLYDVMINAGAAELFGADGALRFDNPETVKAFAFYKQLYQYSPADSADWSWGNAQDCFASGSCGMVLHWQVITAYDKAGGDPKDLGTIAVPHDDDRAGGGSIAYSNGVIILTKDAKKRQAAAAFISWLLEPQQYGRFLNMEPCMFMPVTEDGAKAPTFWDDPMVKKYHAQVEAMISYLPNGKLGGFTAGHVFPKVSAISAQNLMAQALQLELINGETPEAAVRDGAQKMQAAMK